MMHPLDELIDKLDKLDGRKVRVDITRNTNDAPRPTTVRRVYDGTTVDDDFVQKVSERLAEKLRREGVL